MNKSELGFQQWKSDRAMKTELTAQTGLRICEGS